MMKSFPLAYGMKKREKKAPHESSCTSGCEQPCEVHKSSGEREEKGGQSEAHETQMLSNGGMVANQAKSNRGTDYLANEDELEFSYTGKNSGDELGDRQEDMDRKDIVSRVMKSRKKKDRLPIPR